jgi:hypothetical protein
MPAPAAARAFPPTPEYPPLTPKPAAKPLPEFTFECAFEQRHYFYDGERWYEERTYQTPPRATLQRLDERLRALPEYERHRVRRATQRWTALMVERGLDSTAAPASESLPRCKPQARKTRCFRCNEGLSSQVNLQCPTCRWILCECGACGCVSGRS